MTPQEFKQARTALGYTQQALADEWGMGQNGGRSIRRWECGQRPVSSIAAYAVRLMLKAPNNQVAPVEKQLKSSGAD